jgi:hypothetical protein
VRNDLQPICSEFTTGHMYSYTDYCLLQVALPYMYEGINKCLDNEIDNINYIQC